MDNALPDPHRACRRGPCSWTVPQTRPMPLPRTAARPLPCSLTVVICTHNRARLLDRTLDSLDRALRPPHWHVEIVVIANACGDDTAEVLRRRQASAGSRGSLPLRFVEEPVAGKARALNRATALVRTSAVAYVDDDHRVDAGYLIAVCRALETHPDASVFCGRIAPDWDGTEPGWVHGFGPYRIYPPPVPSFDLGNQPMAIAPAKAIPGGGNIFLRAELLFLVGRFCDDLGPVGHDLGGGEDTEWVLRAASCGAVLRYEPDVVQYHYVDRGRLTIPYMMRKAFRRSAAAAGLHRHDSPAAGRACLYLVHKTARHLFAALFSMGRNRRRFYLVRLAASAGELRGLLARLRATRRSPLTGNGQKRGASCRTTPHPTSPR